MRLFTTLIFLLFSISVISQDVSFGWAKQITQGDYNDGKAITTDHLGNVYTTGFFSGVTDFDPGPGVYNLSVQGSVSNWNSYIQKLDPNGNLVWAKAFYGANYDTGNDVKVDGQGNVYITGWYRGTVDFDPGAGVYNLTSNGDGDAFVVKLNTQGDFLWANSFGGTADDYGNSIDLDSLGNVLVTGSFKGTVDFDPGTGVFNLQSGNSNAGFVLKLSNTGQLLWCNGIIGAGNAGGRTIKTSNSGYIYVSGGYSGTIDFDPGSITNNLTAIGTSDIFIQKLDTSGNLVWIKSIGSLGWKVAHDMELDELENIYLTGGYTGTMDFNPNQGSYSITSNGGNDIFIAKFDSSSNIILAKTIGGIDYENGNSVAVNQSGEMYISGDYSGSSDFDPGAGIVQRTSNGNSDIFIEKLDNQGNFVWVKVMGGSWVEGSHSIALDKHDNVLTTGYFRAQTDFNPGTGVYNLTPGAGMDIFIHKLLTCNTFDTLSPSVCITYTSPSGNHTWTASGVYADTISNAQGCDSILTINLTIKNSSDSTITVTSCDSYSSLSGNYNWTSSGTYQDTLTNVLGCDSLLTIDLTIKNSSSSSKNVTVCNSYTSPDGQVVWSTSGIYKDTLVNSIGCDSIITINLKVNKSVSFINRSTCDSLIAPSGNYVWKVSGTYKDTISNHLGCDSLMTIKLTVVEVDTSVTTGVAQLESNATNAQYQWFTCNGDILPGETNKVLKPFQNGSYKVKVTEQGCSDTSSCYVITNVGLIESINSKNISFYPNPTHGMVKVELPSAENNVQVTVLNSIGQQVANYEFISTNGFELNIPGSKGLYYVKVENENVSYQFRLLKY